MWLPSSILKSINVTISFSDQGSERFSAFLCLFQVHLDDPGWFPYFKIPYPYSHLESLWRVMWHIRGSGDLEKDIYEGHHSAYHSWLVHHDSTIKPHSLWGYPPKHGLLHVFQDCSPPRHFDSSLSFPLCKFNLCKGMHLPAQLTPLSDASLLPESVCCSFSF